MESWWTPETSKSNFRGQKSMNCGILYVIGKLLKRRCLKWVHIAHLYIWNTSYGQKKGPESNYQFDYRPEKVRSQPNLFSCRQRATYHCKALDESYNFTLDCTSIRGLFTKLRASKVAGVLGEKNHLDVGLVERCRVYFTIRGKVVASPKSGPWWVLCVHVVRDSF